MWPLCAEGTDCSQETQIDGANTEENAPLKEDYKHIVVRKILTTMEIMRLFFPRMCSRVSF